MPPVQRGMALLVVLLMIAIMALLATRSNLYGRRALAQAETQQATLQAKWDLLGAERWFLATQALDQPASLLRQRQFGAHLLHFDLRDNQACFNLNALLAQRVADDNRTAAPSVARQVFLTLLDNLGLSATQASELMQQLFASARHGAQVNQWRLFDEVSQIKALPAVSPALWQQLQPLLCVTPETRLAININGLTPDQMPLLRALFAGKVAPSRLHSLLKARPEEGWQDFSLLLATLGPQRSEAAVVTLQSVAVMHSRYFELLIWADHPTLFSALRSRIEKTQDSYRVSARLYGLSE